MDSNERDRASILDAIIFAELILEFTLGMEKSDFLADSKTQAAILYQITILGEAFRRTYKDFQQQHPEIPYSQIIAMRNRLIHDYGKVDLDVAWNVVKQEISRLLILLKPLVPTEH
jgi:uncharacterized protein with HEPN domain